MPHSASPRPTGPVRTLIHVLAVAATVAGPAAALDIALPEGAVAVAATPPAPGTQVVATGPWRDGTLPTETLTGLVSTAVWQVPAAEIGSVGAMAEAIAGQLRQQGYEVVFDCADAICGGFDFRVRLDMGTSPEMHVDIGDFRYLLARDPEAGPAVAATVSRGADIFYLHVVRIGDEPDAAGWVTPSTRAPEPETVPPDPVAPEPAVRDAMSELVARGAFALDDLTFRTGASELSGRDYPSLVALAEFLSADPARRVILVGHTDSRGGRDSNQTLSEARATAVRRHLVAELGVNPAQVEAAGIGFLAPRATNDTPEGREANRRVEVVLLEDG